MFGRCFCGLDSHSSDEIASGQKSGVVGQNVLFNGPKQLATANMLALARLKAAFLPHLVTAFCQSRTRMATRPSRLGINAPARKTSS